MYDSGFRLPYYGPDADWLRVEIDHSHRLSRSNLLPDELQQPGGLTFLPTNSRLYGVVRVDTGMERRIAEDSDRRDYLALQVSRDRLLDNDSYQELRRSVRWALDYYAVKEAERTGRERLKTQPIVPYRQATDEFRTVVASHKSVLPSGAYKNLSAAEAVERAVELEPTRIRSQAALLGALATAGASALAYEHEIDKQLSTMEALADDLAALELEEPARASVKAVEQEIRIWLERARGTKDLFSYLAREDYRADTDRRPAKGTIKK